MSTSGQRGPPPNSFDDERGSPQPAPAVVRENAFLSAVRSGSPTRDALAAAPSSPARRRPNQVRFSAERQFLEGAQQLLGGASREPKNEGVGQLVLRAAFNTPLYPVKYVQRLIQLGHEPTAPEKRFSVVFQRYMYYYPGVVGYGRTIYQTEGWRGLYRGVSAAFAEDVVGLTTSTFVRPAIQSVVNKIPLPFYSFESGDVPDSRDTLPSILTRGSRMFLGNLLTNCIVQLTVHPFHVISVRTMAQFVGKETTYSGVVGSIKEIYRTEGMAGFYAGIVPALLGHVCTCIIHSSLWLMFEIIVSNISHEMGKLVVKTLIAMPLLAYIPSSYSYPFFLMMNVMAVNNSGLVAGTPPKMPLFTGWMDCYRYLKSTGNLYRGSVILFARFAYKDIPAVSQGN